MSTNADGCNERFDKGTVSAGVNMLGAIEISLSSQTGYSTNLEEVVNFSGEGHPLCGTEGQPGFSQTMGLLQVHASITN